MVAGQGEDAGSHLKAVDIWYAVWCYEHAYKVEMLDTKTMISMAVSRMGGTLIRKRNPGTFHKWWLNTEHSKSRYVLILHWREAKPCFDLLEKELAQGNVHRMPQAIFLVPQTGKSFRHASSWASLCSHHLKPTVAPEMTRDGLQAWLSGWMNKTSGGAMQCGAEPLAGCRAAGHNQDLLQCHANLKTTSCHEHVPSPKGVELLVKIGSSSGGAKIQFSFGSFAVADLVESLQNPCLASWLDSLLVKSMPEIYID